MALPSEGQAADFTVQTPSSALTDFTVPVDLSNMPPEWWADVNTNDGTRGRASNPEGTIEYAVDWIDFDAIGDTGQAYVLVPGSHGTGTGVQIRLYPPNTRNATVAVGDTYGRYAAYSSDWIGYWPKGGGEDRTSNQNNGTANGGVALGGATGPFGAATTFDGTDDWFDLGGMGDFGASPGRTQMESGVTVMGSFKTTVDDAAMTVIGNNRDDSPSFGYQMNWKQHASPLADVAVHLWRQTSNWGWYQRSGNTHPTHVDGNWHHFAFAVVDGTGGTYRFDGSSEGIANLDSVLSPFQSWDCEQGLGIGASPSRSDGTPQDFWEGDIQQVVLLEGDKGSAWIEHWYNATNDNAAFIGTVTPVTLGASNTRVFFVD